MFTAEQYEMGQKVFFWYRLYCVVVAFLSLAVAGLGIFLAVVPLEPNSRDQQQIFLMGIVYAILGIGLFLVFAVAALLPPKPYNWVVGMVMICLGFTSCCFWPFAIPLIIFWVKPETQVFLGRKISS